MKISLCVVAYNEEKLLPRLLEDFKAQTYPRGSIEVVLVDGRSTDGTRRVMEAFACENLGFLAVKVVDNPRRTQPSGWNVALKAATGEAIIRLDAHARVPADFVALRIADLENGEDVSGGVCLYLTEDDSSWGRTLLATENSLFGSSVASHRRFEGKTYVKTAPHAAYRREVFAKVGGFNENLQRSEDNEIHRRVRRAGYRISFDSSRVSYQYARPRLCKMIKQKYGNGKWIGLTLGVCPDAVSSFHFVPFCFVAAIVLTTAACCFGFWQGAAALWSLYGLFAVVSTVRLTATDGFEPLKLLTPALFLASHVAYGVGTCVGLAAMPFLRKRLATHPEVEAVKLAMNAK